jgi:hypothetical protein
MSDTIATPTGTTPNAENATSRGSSPTPGQAIWHNLLATARHISSEGRSLGPLQVRAFLGRHWLLTACSCALVLLLLKPAMRLATSIHTGAMAEDGSTGRMQVQAPLGRPIASGRTELQATKEYTPTSASAELEEGEETPVNAVPGFAPSAPMIARTISLFLVAKDFASSRAALESILARHHGYAASLTASTQQNAARSLQASLRIPAAELNAAVTELKSLGRVENENQTGEEVTQQHADLVARLKNSRETEQRLQAILLQRTGKISDVLAVEQEIALVRGEIEQMEAEQKGLEHRVAFATVDLNLAEEYKAQISSPSPAVSTRIHNAGVRGYKDAVEDLLGMVLLFAEYGPTLLIWLTFLVPAAWLVRRRWHRISAARSSLSA